MNNFSGDSTFVQRGVVFALRTDRAGSESLMNQVREAVWSVSSDVPLASVRTMDEIYRASMARSSFALVMLAIAGGMALLLGVVGIYGVISYSVSQRTRELGIRIALGAPLGALKTMVVRQGVALASAGVIFGLAAAAALMRLCRRCYSMSTRLIPSLTRRSRLDWLQRQRSLATCPRFVPRTWTQPKRYALSRRLLLIVCGRPSAFPNLLWRALAHSARISVLGGLSVIRKLKSERRTA
jgi:hypothetical protein